MRRHETDWLALVLGGLFLVVAAVHIGDGDGANGVDGLKWFVPGVLLLLGVLGIVAAVRGGRPAEATAGPTPRFEPAAADETDAEPERQPDADEPTLRLDREPEGEPPRE